MNTIIVEQVRTTRKDVVVFEHSINVNGKLLRLNQIVARHMLEDTVPQKDALEQEINRSLRAAVMHQLEKEIYGGT